MTVITRFAPAPTGYLHIGSARTALFNWLYARHHGGQFLLRIEDTDRVRSTQSAIDAILTGLTWLGLNWDQDPVYQFSKAKRHAQFAHQLLAEGKAYYCYTTPQELEDMRTQALTQGQQPRYNGYWRDRNPSTAPPGIDPVIRLKVSETGTTTLIDSVQGQVTLDHKQIDDFVLLRGDGTPTYMLSVVIDDHDMGITHIIRGDDHFINSFRQKQLYDALGWNMPLLSHLPLIHGMDGAKLSKRHGALGVEAYQDMGILPEAMCSYLLRLGWSHGDDEIISTPQAVDWFNLESIGKSPARLNFDKLMHVNQHYLKLRSPSELVELLTPILLKNYATVLDKTKTESVLKGLPGLIERSKNLIELAQLATIYTQDVPYPLEDKIHELVTQDDTKILLTLTYNLLKDIALWNASGLEQSLRDLAQHHNLKFGQLAGPLRAALSGRQVSPSVFEMMASLGQNNVLARLQYVIHL